MSEINNNNREIITTRIFPYTREQVFAAWSDPKLLAHWWGPKEFSNTFHEFDFNSGGKWKFTMHGTDGTDYHNENSFTEILVPEKIVFKHLEPIHVFTATAVFEETAENTTLSFRMTFESTDEFDKVKNFIAVANEENFDRLESVLNNNYK